MVRRRVRSYKIPRAARFKLELPVSYEVLSVRSVQSAAGAVDFMRTMDVFAPVGTTTVEREFIVLTRGDDLVLELDEGYRHVGAMYENENLHVFEVWKT